MKGIDTKTPRRYVVVDERELNPEEQTTFLVKNLSLREVEVLRNCMFASETSGKKKSKNTKDRFYLGTQERMSLEIGIVGWENFEEENGRMIPFTKDNLEMIPIEYRAELALEVRRENDPAEDEEKNFVSEHPSTNSKNLTVGDVPMTNN